MPHDAMIPPFRQAVRLALNDIRTGHVTRKTLTALEERRFHLWRAEADATLLRTRAGRIRRRTLANLPDILSQLADRAEARGVKVYWAEEADEVINLLQTLLGTTLQHLALVSGPLMDELRLPKHLAHAGYSVHYVDAAGIVLAAAGEPRTHSVFPLAHMTSRDIALVLEQAWQRSVSGRPAEIVRQLTNHARQIVSHADASIITARFGVAESGSFILLDDEGTRLLSILNPRRIILLLPLDQVVSTWEELDVLVEALRLGAGHDSPWPFLAALPVEGSSAESDQLHVILVDNGRSRILAGEYAESLMCIHCGACALACPVFRAIGGQVYGSPYNGPIGAVVSPLLWSGEYAVLPFASTLCGMCTSACPVGIEIPALLAKLRTQYALPALSKRRLHLWQWWTSGPRVGVHLRRFVVRKPAKDLRLGPMWWPWPASRSLVESWKEHVSHGQP